MPRSSSHRQDSAWEGFLPRNAIVMAKRGLQEDPSIAEARTFLEQLGEKV